MKGISRILIVDGDENTWRTLTPILGRKGWETETARTGREALEKAQKRFFNLTLLDLRLPDMEGIELIARLKETNPDIAVIIVAAYASLETAIQALNNGASAYLTKPLNMDEVLTTVREAREKQRLVGEKRRAEGDLRASEERFREFVEKANDIICTHDLEGNFTSANPAATRIYGYSPEEMLQLNIADIVDPEYLPLARQKVQEKLEGSPWTKPYELLTYSKEGKPVWVEVSARLLERAGQPVEVLGIARDITERKRAEEELRQSFEKLRRAFEGTVIVLVSAVEMKDPYTAGHQRRVTQLTCAIANELGLPKEQIEGLRMASLIHDLGKTTIPAEILSKPGPLSELEYGMIQAHPQVGHDVLNGTIEFPWPVAQIVLQHHERMNGSGYPQGLKGKEIMLEARILAVADVVEAMASYRPYRPAHGIDKALEEISQNRGVLYDPEVVDACLKLFTEKGFAFE